MSDTEWHAWRAEGLGASEVAGVLGISPWATPWSVWARKMGLLPPLEPSEPSFGWSYGSLHAARDKRQMDKRPIVAARWE